MHFPVASQRGAVHNSVHLSQLYRQRHGSTTLLLEGTSPADIVRLQIMPQQRLQ